MLHIFLVFHLYAQHVKVVPGRVEQRQGVVGSKVGHSVVEIVALLEDEHSQGSCGGHDVDVKVESRVVQNYLPSQK